MITHISIVQQPLTEELKTKIYKDFAQHSIAMTGSSGKKEAVSFLAMEADQVIGVITVENFWGALHIKYLIVDENHRGKKIGSLLMQRAIDFGKEQNCPFAFVETMSFQAKGFYEKMGFTLDFTRQGYMANTSIHYLQKQLI